MTRRQHDTPSFGPFGVAVLAIVVAFVAYVSRYGGYACLLLTLAVGCLHGYGTWQAERSWRGVFASLLAVGVIVSAGKCGLTMNASVADSQEDERQRKIRQSQDAQRERARKDRTLQAQQEERADLIRAELERPLAERAAEAERRIEDMSDITAKAHAICYADFLLNGVEETPEITSLRKTRNRVAKAIKAEYKADLKRRRVLICNDGERSGCGCAGSHQGCCSGHGGVARCEPMSEVELVCDPREVDDLIEFHLKAVGRPLPGGNFEHDRGRDLARWYVSPLRSVD